MMEEFTDEQKMLRATMQNFVEKEVSPLAYEIDRDERYPAESMKRLAEMGLMGITVPADFGGAGAGYTEMCIVTEELAVGCLSTSASWGAHATLCVDNIRRNATDQQMKRYLPPLCRGEKIGGLAMTEPSAGSDVMSMRLKAEDKGDHYLLNAVCPGFIATEAVKLHDASMIERIEKRTALKRMGKPEEVAQVVAFLASDGAS